MNLRALSMNLPALSYPEMREWTQRKLRMLEAEMAELNPADEERGTAARERTTIHWPLIECYICHKLRNERGEWFCSAWHAPSSNTTPIHITWKREPRWFD